MRYGNIKVMEDHCLDYGTFRKTLAGGTFIECWPQRWGDHVILQKIHRANGSRANESEEYLYSHAPIMVDVNHWLAMAKRGYLS